MRAPHVNTKPPWLRSCCSRQWLGRGVGTGLEGPARQVRGTDRGRCVLGRAASVYLRESPSALGGLRWCWVDTSRCLWSHRGILRPPGSDGSEGKEGFSDVGAACRSHALLLMAPSPLRLSTEP